MFASSQSLEHDANLRLKLFHACTVQISIAQCKMIHHFYRSSTWLVDVQNARRRLECCPNNALVTSKDIINWNDGACYSIIKYVFRYSCLSEAIMQHPLLRSIIAPQHDEDHKYKHDYNYSPGCKRKDQPIMMVMVMYIERCQRPNYTSECAMQKHRRIFPHVVIATDYKETKMDERETCQMNKIFICLDSPEVSN
jgi:hypothetical protein